jgi:hypothetical protein
MADPYSNPANTPVHAFSLPKPVRYGLQVLAYAAFAVFLGYFSTSPSYRLRGDDDAILKLSFSHSSQLVQACRERSAAELAKLAPNMRTKMDCPRERAPVVVELMMDDKPLYHITTQPAGLHKDGAATVYRRLTLPAGNHRFVARLADGPDGAFRFTQTQDVVLKPGQILVVDFLGSEGGFVFTHG